MKEDEALIEELCSRFLLKPRKCKKINDSNIGSAERIVCIDKNTFYYFPKIQEFQDLDFDKLQYVVPKAGVKLEDILQLKFPPRRENQRNFFSITLPKNRILKFTKTGDEIVVDQYAEGEQEWTFYFDYDIVALPIRERRLREAQERELQNERLRMLELAKLKEKQEKEKAEKINEEINSLNQAQELRSGGAENEEYLRKKQLMTEQEDVRRKINETDELFFHYTYRKLLMASDDRTTAHLELELLTQVGKFRARAIEAVREFIDEVSFTPGKLKYGSYYYKNNLKLKFGQKSLNQEFLANASVANTILDMRDKWARELRVPLKTLIKYKGFKVLVSAVTPLDGLEIRQFDESIIHGFSSDNWKIDFMLVENLHLILDHLKLKPYFSEVHYQKVQIHLGSNLKVLQSQENPYASIKALDPNAFQQSDNYKIIYFYDIDEIFPIDLDFNSSINQENVRLRPEFILKYVEQQKEVSHLSAGSLTYSLDDEEGEKEDINVARASKMLKVQEIVNFVQKLDKLDLIVSDSQEFSTALKQHGINMRYISKVIKLTNLPYVRAMGEIEAVARVVRTLYRDHQKQFVSQYFRERPDLSPLIYEAFNEKIGPSMRKIRMKQLRQEEDKGSRQNASDFLNLMFGLSVEFQPFWSIVRSKVREKYQFEMKEAEDYPHGYLLKTVLYHCGINAIITDKTKLFISEFPFSPDDIKEFTVISKVYDFPSMSIHKLTNYEGIEEKERIITRLELALQIKQALGENEKLELLELSKYTNKIGPPPEKYTIESFYYYLYHPTADNFEHAHKIAMVIFPSSHPAIMNLYLQYAKIKELDPIILKRAAENHAIRNLGISHQKTSEILFNFKESQYVNHLIKAEAGVEPGQKTKLYLEIVRELTRLGKLYESLSYVKRAIKAMDPGKKVSRAELEQYFQILIRGIQNNYSMRTIEELLVLGEILYNSLTRNEIPITAKWYQSLLFYTLKGFLEFRKNKHYLFKLILVLDEEKKEPLTEERKNALMQKMSERWKESRNHINHIKEMLNKLEFGLIEINYRPDFFNKFYDYVDKLANEDFNEAFRDYGDLYLIFGFKYFEDALLENFFTFEKNRRPPNEEDS